MLRQDQKGSNFQKMLKTKTEIDVREEDALQAQVLPKSLAVKRCPEAQGKNKAGFQAVMQLQVYLLI